MVRRYLATASSWLGEALKGGRHNTRALFALGGALLGFTVAASLVGLPASVLATGYFVLCFALLALVLRRLKFDYGTTALILSGFCFYLLYLSYTWYGERNYDGPEQLKYIEYIVQNRSLPPADHCFICHHPPAYYLLGAGAYALVQKTGIADPSRGVQLLSLGIFLALVVFGVLIVRRFTTDLRQIRLATALIVFWPYSIHNCVRVHNDTLVCTLMVAALYFIICFAQERRPRDLYWGAALTAAGILTKSNAVILVPILGAVLLVALIRSQDKLRLLKRAMIVALILGGAVALNTAGKGSLASQPSRGGPLCHRVLGSACKMAMNDPVGNRPYNYVYFDVQSFLKEPFLIARHDGSGRQFFWNHLLKSSLLGTHNEVADRELAYELNRDVAAGLNFLLLAMTAYLALALTFVKKPAARRYWVVALSLMAFLAFMMAFRILIPWTHHSDFRHIFPVLVLVALLYSAAVAAFRSRGSVMEYVGYGLAVPFLLLSMAYFIPKYQWAIEVTARVVKHELLGFSKVVAEGSDWDRRGNLIIEGNHTIELKVNRQPTVRAIDVTLDGNDRYEVKLFGRGGPRTVQLGPKQGVKGMARYIEELDPPVEKVSMITLRPAAGDRAYSLGHFVVR